MTIEREKLLKDTDLVNKIKIAVINKCGVLAMNPASTAAQKTFSFKIITVEHELKTATYAAIMAIVGNESAKSETEIKAFTATELQAKTDIFIDNFIASGV